MFELFQCERLRHGELLEDAGVSTPNHTLMIYTSWLEDAVHFLLLIEGITFAISQVMVNVCIIACFTYFYADHHHEHDDDGLWLKAS